MTLPAKNGCNANKPLDRLYDLNGSLERRAERLRELIVALQAAQREERLQLTRVLHEDILQLLSAARMGLCGLTVRNQNHGYFLAERHRIEDVLHDVILRTRALCHELRPPVLELGDLADVLQWLANDMAAKHGLQVRIQYSNDAVALPENLREAIYYVLKELLSNVLQHAQVEKAEVGIDYFDNSISLHVSDAGIGFDPRQTVQTRKGFGLLSIQERLRFLGGSMTVETVRGCGSNFVVVIPLTPAGCNTEDPGSFERTGQSAEVPALSPATVLVADDHNGLREGLVHLLRNQPGIEVVGEASNGEEAVSLVRELHPNVVLMDVRMPVMDGIEATRVLAREFANLRIIALSMFDIKEIEAKMKAAGACAYLSKTASIEEIGSEIRKCLKV